MPLRLALAAVLLTAAAPVVAFAEPDPPRPVCTLRFRDETISSDVEGVPDVTYRRPYWVC